MPYAIVNLEAVLTPSEVSNPNLGKTRVTGGSWRVHRQDATRQRGGLWTLYPLGKAERPEVFVQVWVVASDVLLVWSPQAARITALAARVPNAYRLSDLPAAIRSRWPDKRDVTERGTKLGWRVAMHKGLMGAKLRREIGALDDGGSAVAFDRTER